MNTLTHQQLADGMTAKPIGTTGHWQTRHPDLNYCTRGIDALTSKAKFLSAYYKREAAHHEAQCRSKQ